MRSSLFLSPFLLLFIAGASLCLLMGLPKNVSDTSSEIRLVGIVPSQNFLEPGQIIIERTDTNEQEIFQEGSVAWGKYFIDRILKNTSQ